MMASTTASGASQRDRQPPGTRAAREHCKMMLGRDADEGAIRAERLHAGEGEIPPARLRIPRDDSARREVRPRLVLEEGRDRQRGEVRGLHHALLTRRMLDDHRGRRMRNRPDEPLLDLLLLEPQAERNALAIAEQVPEHAHLVPRDLLEAERRPASCERQVRRDFE